MKYKIVKDNTVVDIVDNPLWLMPYNNMLVVCEPEEATGVLSSDGSIAYHINGMEKSDLYAEDTIVIQISDEEAEDIKKIMDLGGEVNNENEIVHEEPVEEPIYPDVNLEELRSFIIEAMSRACNEAIKAGVDVTLSDGTTKHFGLTLEDQINLISLQNFQADGVVPYHADGELCTYYSISDINSILQAAAAFKTYHTTYFNSLKNWIKSMQTKAELLAVNYGDEIPAEYQSDVLHYLEQQNA